MKNLTSWDKDIVKCIVHIDIGIKLFLHEKLDKLLWSYLKNYIVVTSSFALLYLLFRDLKNRKLVGSCIPLKALQVILNYV